MHLLVRIAIALVCLWATLGLDRGPAESSVSTFTINGETREALVFPPTLDAGQKAPLVLAFHGHGGNMNGFSRALAIHRFWPRAIVVYLQGLQTESRIDPQGKKPGWQATAGQDGDRDLKFVDAVLDKMHKIYNVDDARIYATGFSNGAFFTYLLWQQRSSVFAAYASVAGRPMEGKLTEARPVLVIAGERDPLVKFADEKNLIQTLRELNGATGKGEPCGEGCTIYRSPTGTPVETFIHGGGHMVPPEAAQLITTFFKEHPRKS